MKNQILERVDELKEELVDFTLEMIRIPTINPPGEHYRDCAELIGDRLRRFGFEVELSQAEGRPEHTSKHPRVNVVGRLQGVSDRPCLHLNGHTDVVPPGLGWSLDPFEGIVRDGRIYGRGSSDMKAGFASAVYAVESLRRAGIDLNGTVEISATVDEESGGFAGAAWLCEQDRIHSGNTDYVIIPEPLNVDRICIGHRGVYWFEVESIGRIAHGSMPFLGVNAIEGMGRVLEALRDDLLPRLAGRRSEMPVVPEGARRPTLNINSVVGGQPGQEFPTPCVADSCQATFDRRFLIEEDFASVRAEVSEVITRVGREFEGGRLVLRDLMVVDPVSTPVDCGLVQGLRDSVAEVLGRGPDFVASPGTYDQKHFSRVGGIEQCVAYGPGVLEQAHQPDEWCSIEDLVNATKVLALSVRDLVGGKP